MIDIATPAGAPPRDLLFDELTKLYDQVFDAASSSSKPPQLDPSITAARAAQARDDVDALVTELRNVAHAAVTSIVRIRAGMA